MSLENYEIPQNGHSVKQLIMATSKKRTSLKAMVKSTNSYLINIYSKREKYSIKLTKKQFTEVEQKKIIFEIIHLVRSHKFAKKHVRTR